MLSQKQANENIPYEPVRMYMISLICQAKSLYDFEKSASDMEWQRDHRSQDLIATEGSIWACGVCLCGCVCVKEKDSKMETNGKWVASSSYLLSVLALITSNVLSL